MFQRTKLYLSFSKSQPRLYSQNILKISPNFSLDILIKYILIYKKKSVSVVPHLSDRCVRSLHPHHNCSRQCLS